ncbi:MAG TPA: hypothetical protein VF401_00845 [Candidatus Saccharimonadales bacterium]
MKHLFYRNIRSKDYLEIFLVTAVSTLLINRFFLYVTGYPQLGGGTLHIAHMLYGGLLMLASITLLCTFLGQRIERLAAFVGGIGFGLFIDELGKFITKDNNYFFRPTIGLIYAIFIILYLVFSFVSRTSRLTEREYELNALRQFEEVVLHDLDPIEKARLLELLERGDQGSPLVKGLSKLLKTVDTVTAPKPNALQKALSKVHDLYAKFWKLPTARGLIGLLLVGQALVFVITVTVALFDSFDTAIGISTQNDSYSNRLLIGEFVSSVVASGFAIVGAFRLRTSRVEAFELFRRSILINLLLTDFFLFTRIQFGAIPSFLVNLAILVGLRYATYEERRLQR